MTQVSKATERNTGQRFLSKDELDSLLGACQESASRDLYLAVLLSVTTGGRQSEILGLQWRDVDLSRQLLHLRARTQCSNKGQVRSVPIAPRALSLLQARKDNRPVVSLHDTDLVFPGKTDPDKPIALRTPWVTALDRSGIQDFRWHDLRHSAASFLAAQGISLLEIGTILGHSSANTTKRYAHLVENHLHDIMRKMADEILR